MTENTKKGNEHLAVAKAMGLSISTKQSIEICKSLRYKTTSYAKEFLEAVISMKRAVPFPSFNRDVGHKPGMAAGRYPTKACSEFLKLVKSAEANAQVKGLDTANLKISKILANKASAPATGGRQRYGTKRSHLEIEVKESLKKSKKADEKKVTKTEEQKSEQDSKVAVEQKVQAVEQEIKEEVKEELQSVGMKEEVAEKVAEEVKESGAIEDVAQEIVQEEPKSDNKAELEEKKEPEEKEESKSEGKAVEQEIKEEVKEELQSVGIKEEVAEKVAEEVKGESVEVAKEVLKEAKAEPVQGTTDSKVADLIEETKKKFENEDPQAKTPAPKPALIQEEVKVVQEESKGIQEEPIVEPTAADLLKQVQEKAAEFNTKEKTDAKVGDVENLYEQLKKKGTLRGPE
jgi:large subunit ribosomal protein L22